MKESGHLPSCLLERRVTNSEISVVSKNLLELDGFVTTKMLALHVHKASYDTAKR